MNVDEDGRAELYPVYTISLANFLTTEKKHRIKYINDNNKDPTHKTKCIWFVKTDELMDDIIEFTEMVNKKKETIHNVRRE